MHIRVRAIITAAVLAATTALSAGAFAHIAHHAPTSGSVNAGGGEDWPH
jgi:Spy/CpxP family protein refolding chaperone